MAKQLVVGEVESGLVAVALERLAATLTHEIQTGRARKIRSQEYERLREIIVGGATYGAGLLKRVGEPIVITPAWEPLIEPTPIEEQRAHVEHTPAGTLAPSPPSHTG